MRVLVTGGAGFIGSNLCRALTESAEVDEVTVLDDLSTGHLRNIAHLDVRFVEGSILDSELVGSLAARSSAIVHLAALGSVPRSVGDPMRSHEVNATGTLQVLNAARAADVEHVVLASSSSVYGANETMPKSEALRCMPMSPYAVTKLATEQYGVAFAECYGMSVLPFRFFNVYGPHQRAGHVYAAVIPAFLDAVLRGEALRMNGDGTQTRDFTYVGTVVDVIMRALRNRTTAGPTNLAFGSQTSLLELVTLIERATGRAARVEFGPDRPGDVRHSSADNANLRSLFPDLRPVALHRGISETAAWMESELFPTQGERK